MEQSGGNNDILKFPTFQADDEELNKGLDEELDEKSDGEFEEEEDDVSEDDVLEDDFFEEDEEDEYSDEEEYEYEEERDARSNRPKARGLAAFALAFVQSSSARKVIVGLSIASVLLVAQMYLLPVIGFGQDRDMRMMQTEYGVNYPLESSPQFHSNDSRFYYVVTHEGISMRSSNDVLVWHNSFSFNRQHASFAGDIVAVSELERGRVVHVFNDSGLMFSTSFDNPILSFNVNAAGYLAAIVHYDGGYGVYVLNSEHPSSGSPLFSWSVFRNDRDLIHPIFAEVCEDGRYIVIAYVDLNTRVTTVVEFRYINQWDAWGTEMGLFAAEIFNGVILAMRFMSGNRLLVVTAEEIICFQVGPDRMFVDVLWRNRLENRLDHIEFYGGSHFVLAIGDRLVGTFGEGYPVGTIHIYNMSGARTGSFQTGRRATLLNVGHNAVIAGADRSFAAIDFRGVLLWEHVAMFDTRDVIFLDDTSSILIAGPNRADVFRRRRVRDDGGSFFELEIFQ